MLSSYGVSFSPLVLVVDRTGAYHGPTRSVGQDSPHAPRGYAHSTLPSSALLPQSHAIPVSPNPIISLLHDPITEPLLTPRGRDVDREQRDPPRTSLEQWPGPRGHHRNASSRAPRGERERENSRPRQAYGHSMAKPGPLSVWQPRHAHAQTTPLREPGAQACKTHHSRLLVRRHSDTR